MKIIEALKSINPYPVPNRVIQSIAILRGLDLEINATDESLSSNEFRLSKADLYKWLYFVPDVTQEGISYSFSDEEKKAFKDEANDIYEDLGEPTINNGVTYGYKGRRI